MALKYEINMFETDPDDASKTFVTFIVTNENDKLYIISKSVTTGSKSNEVILKEAQALAQSEIDAWASKQAVIGSTWNPDTEAIE